MIQSIRLRNEQILDHVQQDYKNATELLASTFNELQTMKNQVDEQRRSRDIIEIELTQLTRRRNEIETDLLKKKSDFNKLIQSQMEKKKSNDINLKQSPSPSVSTPVTSDKIKLNIEKKKVTIDDELNSLPKPKPKPSNFYKSRDSIDS
jgi:hypothetical protein